MKTAQVAYCLMLLILSVSCGVTFAEENADDRYSYRNVCPAPAGGNMVADKWNFYQCDCTSYVADRLNKAGIDFNNSYKKVAWGYAANWKSAAKKAGLSVNGTPRKGAVAWFSYGHVAYVEKVDGKKIIISEYNYEPSYDHNRREINASSVSSYLHIR